MISHSMSEVSAYLGTNEVVLPCARLSSAIQWYKQMVGPFPGHSEVLSYIKGLFFTKKFEYPANQCMYIGVCYTV